VTSTAAARTASAPAPSPDHLVRWRWAAGLGALGAGTLHVAAAVEHASAGDLVVGFFLLTTFAQLGIGLWLLQGSWLGTGPGTGPLAIALAGTVLLVCLYLVVHTTDLLAGLTGHEGGHAAGPEAGHAAAGHHEGAAVEADGPVALGDRVPADPEPPDLLGTATVALELLSVLALTALLPRTWRGRALNALLALGALAWVAWLTGVLG
jgi:hypothetical protein